MKTRIFLRAVVVAIVVCGGGCPARRDGISRDALDRSFTDTNAKEALATTASLLQLRVPTPATLPKVLSGSASEQAFARGDDIADADVGDEAAILRCLRADALRDYATIITRCLDVVSDRPGDLRTTVIVALLNRHLSSLDDDARRKILKRTDGLVDACRSSRGDGSCAWLAITAQQLRRNAAHFIGDDATVATVADSGVFFDRADVDGPWLDADQSFAGQPRASAPLLPHPRREQRVVSAVQGRVYPSRRGPSGWYRLAFSGEVAVATTAHLFVDPDGPFEARVDGVAVIVRPRGVASAPMEWVALQLAPGPHEIEVFGWESSDGIAVAVIDDDGRRVVTPTTKKKWKKTGASTVRDSELGLSSLLLPPRLDGSDTHTLLTVVLRHHAARAGLGANSDELQHLNAALLANWGWSPVALILGAQGVEDDVLPGRFLSALAAPLWARAEALWPQAPLPLLARARLAAVEQPDAALDLYRQLVQTAPNYPLGRRELLPRLLERDLVDEALDTATGLLALGATVDNIDAALPALQAAGHHTEAARLLDERSRRRRSRLRWSRDLQAGETDQVRARLRALADASADNDDNDDDSARLYATLDLLEPVDTAAAMQLLERAIADDPKNERLRLRRARLLAVVNGDAAALAALTTTTTTSLSALLLAGALGAPLPWNAALKQGDAVLQTRRAGSSPFAQHPMVMLLNSNEHLYADDGSALVLRHWIAEVRNKDAIDSIGELKKADNELLVRLRVIKPDGSMLEPEHHTDVEDISLTGLSPGDIVEWLSARVDHTAQAGDAILVQSLASRVPVVSWSYGVSWPTSLSTSRSLQLQSLHGAPPPVVSTAGGRIINRYEQRDLAATLPEPMSVDDVEDLPLSMLTIDFDDDAIRRSRALSLVPPARADGWLREAAVSIAGRGDDDERLRRVFRFVAERITEADSPTDAISTLATGQGQRLPLLLAMTQAVGLNAVPIALHPPLLVDVEQPSPAAFPSLAIAVGIGDRQHVVAVVSDVVLLDRLPTSFRNALTLDLRTGARGVLPNSAIDPAAVELQLELALIDVDEAPVLKGLAVLRLPAAVAEGIRQGVRSATPEQLAQFMEAGLAASIPGVAASNVTLPGLDSAGGPMALVADVVVPAGAGTVRFEHLFAQGAAAAFRAGVPLAAFVQVAERRRTMRVWPHDEHLEMVVRLPSSAGFVEVPRALDLVAGPFALQQRAAVADGVLVWDRTLRFAAARIGPEQWSLVRAGLAPIIADADARLGFVVGDIAAPQAP